MHNLSSLVTLNLFQGPCPVSAADAALAVSNGLWILNQVQHVEMSGERAE